MEEGAWRWSKEREGRRERKRDRVCVCVCVVQNEAREGGARAHSLVATLRSFVSDLGLPRWHSDKEPPCQCRRHKRCGFSPWVGKIPWSRAWQPTPVFLPGEFHGQRSLAGYSPWSCKELDLTEQLALSVVRLSHHSPPHSLLPFLHSCMCMLSSFSCVRLFAIL